MFAALSLLALAAASAPTAARQATTGEWTIVPDRLLVIDADGSTSRCGWFVTLEDRLVALRSTSAAPKPERNDHPFPKVRAVVEGNPNHQPLPTRGLMITADGQRLPGEPGFSSGRLVWTNRWTGEVQVSLDELAAIRFAPEGEIPDANDSDVVELLNGDRIRGLVGSIGVDVSIEEAGTAAPSGAPEREAMRIPFERVRSIRLVPAPIEPKGPRAWFADGTVASGRIVADEQAGGMQFIPALGATSRPKDRAAESIRVRPEDLRAYLPDVGQVVPFASIPAGEILATGTWPSYAPPELQVSRTPGPADAPDIVLHGPSTVRWTLPKGPWILVAEAMPDAPDPEWTSFDLVVRNGAREIFRRTISAESRPIELRLPLGEPSLSIEVTEGDRGPIADAVRLRRAMLLRP